MSPLVTIYCSKERAQESQWLLIFEKEKNRWHSFCCYWIQQNNPNQFRRSNWRGVTTLYTVSGMTPIHFCKMMQSCHHPLPHRSACSEYFCVLCYNFWYILSLASLDLTIWACGGTCSWHSGVPLITQRWIRCASLCLLTSDFILLIPSSVQAISFVDMDRDRNISIPFCLSMSNLEEWTNVSGLELQSLQSRHTHNQVIYRSRRLYFEITRLFLMFFYTRLQWTVSKYELERTATCFQVAPWERFATWIILLLFHAPSGVVVRNGKTSKCRTSF